jgi:hypothetical protein
MGRTMSTAMRLWTLIAALLDTPRTNQPIFQVYYVSLRIRRMGTTMSIATRPLPIITALNDTPSSFTFTYQLASVARKSRQNQVLLRRSQQIWTNTEVFTTMVAHCAGPIFCSSFNIANFTVEINPVSIRRTSATRCTSNYLRPHLIRQLTSSRMSYSW